MLGLRGMPFHIWESFHKALLSKGLVTSYVLESACDMSKPFDIEIASLTDAHPRCALALSPRADARNDPGARSFYIETFGCQMNVHDSEKVAGVLLERGYRPVDTAADADFLLYNTCSIREKAAQKVFQRLNDFKFAAKANRKVIGVLGCVAQQEGEDIFERAPWVSLVCGSASYRNLPNLIEQVESGGRRVTGLDLDTDETFETEITRRDNPFRAYLTIIEGCDYSCSYCVVPHTRGPERSRASDSILAEVRRLADSGYTEIQLLGQTVNSYRDPSPRKWNFVDLLLAVAEVEGIRRVRFTTSHPNDFTREIVEAIDATPCALRPHSSPGAVRLDAHLARNAPHLLARAVPREDQLDSRGAPAVQLDHRCDRRLPGRDGG